MIRLIRLVPLVSLLILLVSCTQSQPVRTYCDTELSYTLWKQESGGFRLYLQVGQVEERVCKNQLLDSARKINLSQDVASLEEADKLIAEDRQKVIRE